MSVFLFVIQNMKLNTYADYGGFFCDCGSRGNKFCSIVGENLSTMPSESFNSLGLEKELQILAKMFFDTKRINPKSKRYQAQDCALIAIERLEETGFDISPSQLDTPGT